MAQHSSTAVNLACQAVLQVPIGYQLVDEALLAVLGSVTVQLDQAARTDGDERGGRGQNSGKQVAKEMEVRNHHYHHHKHHHRQNGCPDLHVIANAGMSKSPTDALSSSAIRLTQVN